MILYERKNTNGRDLSSYNAFSIDDRVEFKLLIPRRCGATSVRMHLFGEGIENKLYRGYEFAWDGFDGPLDIYKCDVNMTDVGVGLYYYKYEIVAEKTTFYGDGKVIGELSEIASDGSGMIQLLVYQDSGNHANWMRGGIMYHVFVDRFNKSRKCQPKKNAVMNDDWYGGIPQYADVPGGYVENNMFFGGDLYGIIEKLDFIKSLGVSCLYLSPIFDAYSNHKYDTADYMSIDSMFGSEEALDKLISESKKRDIHIIFDGVFNHTGADSIYFNKFDNYSTLGAYQSKESPYYEWYNFRSFPDDYECWWDVKILPRVNSNCPSYQKFILGKGGVVEKWMKKGIDGFRLDVADELSDDFLRALNERVKAVNPNGIVYGEVWEDASNKIAYGNRKKYFLGNELDSVMNYPLREAIIKYVKFGDSAFFYNTCKMLYSHYPKHNADLLMNLLGTHDTERILTVLGGESGDGYTNEQLSVKRMTESEKKRATELLKLAYTIVATVPGVPCIYYGDEAGMEGYRDPFNRMPYPWGKENAELLEHYKKINGIRLREQVYKDGFFEILECNQDFLAFARYGESDFLLTIVNRSDKKYKIYSSVSLKNCETGKKTKAIEPCSSFILKGEGDPRSAQIEFYL